MVEIREARPEDVVGVLRLEQEVVGAPHWVAGVYGAMVAEEHGGGGVRRRLMVAEVDGRMVGFAVASLIGDERERWGELESVVVAETWRRVGVGARLCRACMTWCAGEGARWMELEVRTGSEGVRRMYTGLGFVEVGRRKEYYRAPTEDAVLMRAGLGDGLCFQL